MAPQTPHDPHALARAVIALAEQVDEINAAVAKVRSHQIEQTNRLVRMETRLVRLMAHNGMSTPQPKDSPLPGMEHS